jgi:hypothetical protein
MRKDFIFGELQMGMRSWGRPLQKCTRLRWLQYRNVCGWNMRESNIVLVAWEQDVIGRFAWRGKIRNGIVVEEVMIANGSGTKRLKRHTYR